MLTTAGQYVIVHAPGITTSLSVCEVQVFSAGPLISRGRSTTQSSQHWRFGSERAVDGSRESNLMLGSCTHTLQEEAPWWRVALDSSHRVQAVAITNLGDAHGARLHGAQVRVGDSAVGVQHGAGWLPQCGHDFSPPTGGTVEVVCHNGPIPGRYVYVILPGAARILSLCEVEVYGTTCDRACMSTYTAPQSMGAGDVGAPGVPHPQDGFCRLASATGNCDEKDPITSTSTHVSTWGVDH